MKRKSLLCIGLLVVCFLSLSLNTNCQAKQQKSENKIETTGYIDYIDTTSESELDNVPDSCDSLVTTDTCYSIVTIDSVGPIFTTHSHGTLVTKTLKYKICQEKRRKSAPNKLSFTLDLSLEYPISDPKKLMRVLNDTLLHTLCNLCWGWGYTDKPANANSWEEIPKALITGMKENFMADNFSFEEDSILYERGWGVRADLKQKCATSHYATYILDWGIWRPYGMMTSTYWDKQLYCADAKTGKLIGFNDIFRSGCEKQLRPIFYNALRENNKDWDVNIKENNLPLTKNVALSPNGIIVQYLCFDLDEVLGRGGEPSFILPIAKVRHLLTPYALSLLEK